MKDESAFPGFEHFIGPENRVLTGQPHGGLTKREHAAIQIAAGLVSDSLTFQSCHQAGEEISPKQKAHEVIANLSVKIADAILSELSGAGR